MSRVFSELSESIFVCTDNDVFHIRVKYTFSQHFNFIFIWGIGFLRCSGRRNIWRLQYFRDFFEIRVANDIIECIEPNFAKADILMTVFCGPYL